MRIIVYGAGYEGNNFVETFVERWKLDEKFKIEAILDRDFNKQGKFICGIPILCPEELKKVPYDIIIIASLDYASEIKHDLIHKYSIEEQRIYKFNDIIFEGMNMGDLKTKEGEVFSFEKRRCANEFDCSNELETFFLYKQHRLMTKWLHYFEIYDRHFRGYRGKDITVLEIGVFKGGSLQMWKEYFGNRAHIIGIDINPECKQYEEENISIRIGSQEDREFLKKIAAEFPSIDIVIDDGGHTMNQQIVSFEELFDCVSDGGIYLCEDLHTSYMKEYGGEYQGDTFIEYSKDFIDHMNAWYSQDKRLVTSRYTKSIKALHYYDSVAVIEKKQIGPAASMEVNTL